MRFRLSIIFTIAVAILTTADYTSAQTMPITEQEYRAGIRSGYAATRKAYPRRETKIYEVISNGKVTYHRTEIFEYQTPDNYYTKEEIRQGDRTTSSEMIQIGIVRYCRENAAKWKSSGCYENPPAALGDAYETSYSLETTTGIRTYIRTAKSQQKESDKSEPTRFVTEDRFVLNSDGAVRERSIVKMLTATKSIVSRDTSKFEYGVILKPIEAPMK
jgi:hypothetical protein